MRYDLGERDLHEVSTSFICNSLDFQRTQLQRDQTLKSLRILALLEQKSLCKDRIRDRSTLQCTINSRKECFPRQLDTRSFQTRNLSPLVCSQDHHKSSQRLLFRSPSRLRFLVSLELWQFP